MPLGQPAENFSTALAEARRERKALASRAANIASGNEEFNRLLHRTRADLSMLLTETPHGSYPYAGIPWYSTPFGRDAEITALMTLWMDPQIALGVLSYLAANQAQEDDVKADAQPGKILHEVRRGEMAETGEVPFRRYYGSVDSTPLFVMLAGAYLERTGDVDTICRLFPAIKAAMGWIDTYADRDGDGCFEYFRESDKGLSNQGWKDSQDSIFHSNGKLAPGSIALVEMQGYVYEARLRAAEICRSLDMIGEAAAYEEQANAVREKVEAYFWSDRLSNYVLALDGDKRPCEVQASNAGHLLFCRLSSAERAARVADTLMGPAFYSGWGIRTIAAGEARYDACSYHDGSIWPHDNALIGMGFGAYGMRDKAARVLEGLFEASLQTTNRRLPELFAGFDKTEGQGPVPSEEIACSPQAWVTSAPLGLLQACLGLGFDTHAQEVYFEDPFIPHYLGGKVVLHNLKIGDASIDVSLEGDGYDVRLEVLAIEGTINAAIRTTRGKIPNEEYVETSV
jgi:glycogen debranching enzyme